MQKKTVSNYLIDKFAAYGAKHVFGVPGDYILNLFKDMSESSKVKVITTCDEQGAGFAADAYSRLNGFGAIVVTWGAGALKVRRKSALF
jgi:indolepyruvate decarboxylase